MKAGIDFIGIGCGALVINEKNEVLLIKRSAKARTEPGSWSRPGGQVEFGETVEHAVEREMEEEVGIKVKAVKLLDMTQIIEEGKHWIAFGYLATYISGTPINKEPDKHEEIKWFSLDNLPENLNSYTANSIRSYRSGVPFGA